MIFIYLSGLIAFLATLGAGLPYLNFLKKNFYGQYIREDGPESHAKKSGTPTMGGIVIVIPAIIVSLATLIVFKSLSVKAIIVLTSFLLFMLLGFDDDYKKIAKKQNKGLSARGKLLIQSLMALIPAVYITAIGETSISLFGLGQIDIGYLYPVFAVIVIIGASNAVNLTDGLDGLASGAMFFALFACFVISVITGSLELAAISFITACSCIGFLFYNKSPAKMFMGDTGSLALGGLLGTIAVAGKFELWLIPIGAVFVIETLSVILQVASFKLTGKRIFKMSPIHHHYELLGWTEQKVVYHLWLLGALFSVLSCLLFMQVSL